MPPKTSNHAKVFLSALTRDDQARAIVRWHLEDYVNWRITMGYRYPASLIYAERLIETLQESAADAQHPGHSDALLFLDHARERVIEAPLREKKARAEARAERERQKYEEQGVEIEKPVSLRSLRGRKVWLYHGTTSTLLRRILAEGIVSHGRHGTISNVGSSAFARPSDRVFLTARVSGPGSAEFYAANAARRHGGDPIVLRVLVSGDDLERDQDDADLSGGSWQFEIDEVLPSQIMEVDGERVRASARKKPATRRNGSARKGRPMVAVFPAHNPASRRR